MKIMNICWMVCLFISLNKPDDCTAQTNVYHPFPDSNAYWRLHEVDYSHPGVPARSDIEIYIDGDTIVNNNTYHKLMKRGDYSYNVIGYHQTADQLFGIMWQDATQKRVYYRDKFNLACFTCDSLLYDFNLQAGDTVINNPEFNWIIGRFGLIHSIDSIFINGSYRKKYNIGDEFNNLNGIQVIEGIGSTLGGFYQYYYFEQYKGLDCFVVDNIPVATVPGYACAPLVTAIQDDQFIDNEIQVYPNPIQNRFTLTSNSFIDEVILINPFGQKSDCLQFSQNGNKTEVYISKYLPDGLYYLIISSGERMIHKPVIVFNK